MENKENVNVLDNLINNQQEAINQKPAPKQLNGATWIVWVGLSLTIIIPPLGLAAGIYAYLGREDNKEIEVVALMDIGIGAFMCLSNVLLWFMFM